MGQAGRRVWKLCLKIKASLFNTMQKEDQDKQLKCDAFSKIRLDWRIIQFGALSWSNKHNISYILTPPVATDIGFTDTHQHIFLGFNKT